MSLPLRRIAVLPEHDPGSWYWQVPAVAQLREIQLRSVQATLEGAMDIQGILGVDSDVRNGFDGIKVTYKIDGDASPDQFGGEIRLQIRKREDEVGVEALNLVDARVDKS